MVLNKFIKNKRGGEKWLSIWWFFVLVVIGTGIVVGVLIFYSADIDARDVEAEILNKRISGCIVNNGYLNEKLNAALLENCNLDKEVIDKYYYIEILVYDFDSCERAEKEGFDCSIAKVLEEPLKLGKLDFEEDCWISKTIIAKHYPKCKEKFVYALDEDGNKLMIRILTGANQGAVKWI